jgi:SAM-dependent methyltransferase
MAMPTLPRAFSRRSLLALGAAALPAAATQEPARPHREPDVIYVATPQAVVEAMLRMANTQATDVVYDLGCGDGRVVITAAQKFGARGVGIDINPERLREANENARKAGVAGRVKFVEGDLFQTDLREASVVTLYLLTALNLRLRPRLWSQLKPGSRVVSHAFDMREWRPDREETVGGRTIFLWTLPPKNLPAEK